MRWRNALFVITRERKYRLIDSHKKFPREIFNVASATARKGGCQGWHAIKKRGERFSTSLATAPKGGGQGWLAIKNASTQAGV
ncbi:hypothetical protein KU73_03640 [Pectobacterium wasabiae]|uniref:Transcriptional regulator n=1 Tax=Pectobacterium wasabiae TaxID=55208 RepID=A0AAW3EJE1_9GAMM|nr:hypothetical protein A7983_02090 [Pectobacterium wasabiae CFBP 3304]KFX08371.1 hypothetical protein JV38_10795 [Pectobacterium wasabiae]KGA31007.1 hypothetical protein KU73_03640 [Pectobacterium wasabiae]